MQLFSKLHSNPCDCLLITFVRQLVIVVSMTLLIVWWQFGGAWPEEVHCENLVVGGNVVLYYIASCSFSCCT